MAAQIVWSDSAIADLTEIVRYIARDNPETARRYGLGLVEQAEMLSVFPQMGSWYPRWSKGPIREITYQNHRIFYEIKERPKRIHIYRLRHVAQDLPR